MSIYRFAGHPSTLFDGTSTFMKYLEGENGRELVAVKLVEVNDQKDYLITSDGNLPLTDVRS